MMTFKPFDVVELPFPFSDLSSLKKRKALVLSTEYFNKSNNAVTVAMITSRAHSEWIGDVQLEKWNLAGLKKPCYLRLKFFTADIALFSGKVGVLDSKDQLRVRESINKNLFIVPVGKNG
jgi:mRNA interferase MazF